jgi:adenylate cyclase
VRDADPSFFTEAPDGPPETAPDPKPPSAFGRALARLRSGKEPARAVLRRFRRPHGLGHETTVRFIREAERRAQQRAGLVRLVIAALLVAAVEWAGRGIPGGDPVIVRQIEAARVILGLFALLGLSVYLLARKGIATSVLPFATALGDAALILGGLAYNQVSLGVPGNFLFSFPLVWTVPIALAANAVYYRPGVQVFATSLYVVGLPVIAFLAGNVAPAARAEPLARLALLYGPPPNGVRLIMVVGAGLVLILAALQGRRLLERAVRETTLRLNLTRYLPRELAPVLSEAEFENLRQGQRITVALLFVDIRDSSALGISMEPAELARFVTAFRRRVIDAAARHGGVVDKFIGDGALIVFGVPSPGADDAAQALACGRTLLDLVERWNEKHGFDPPVRIGIGVHRGEVFCGVVGDEGRLEFTVLGEAVNLAARLEQATKTLGHPLLASREVVEAAGEGAGWVEVACEPLPGSSRPVAILTPRDASEAP